MMTAAAAADKRGRLRQKRKGGSGGRETRGDGSGDAGCLRRAAAAVTRGSGDKRPQQ